MKTHFILPPLIAVFLLSCREDISKVSQQPVDSIPPVINLRGNKIDTAYLQISSTTLIANGVSGYTWLPGNSTANYVDAGVTVLEEIDGQLRCSDIPVEITGTVNNKFPGTYILYYSARDASGNKAAGLSRTVHVVENGAAFLNGNYNVACSCTAVIASSPDPTITTANYTASAVMSGRINNSFSLSALKIGPECVIASTFLNGNTIDVGFYGPEYANSSTSGTLSVTKNAFIIESKVQMWSPPITYSCKNIYVRSMVEGI